MLLAFCVLFVFLFLFFIGVAHYLEVCLIFPPWLYLGHTRPPLLLDHLCYPSVQAHLTLVHGRDRYLWLVGFFFSFCSVRFFFFFAQRILSAFLCATFHSHPDQRACILDFGTFTSSCFSAPSHCANCFGNHSLKTRQKRSVYLH